MNKFTLVQLQVHNTYTLSDIFLAVKKGRECHEKNVMKKSLSVKKASSKNMQSNILRKMGSFKLFPFMLFIL